MKKLLPCVLACIMLCSCAGTSVTPTPESTVTVVNIPKEDKISKDDLLPIHVCQDDTLYRVYFSSSEPITRVMSKDFTHYYGGKEYSVFKYYRDNDLLFFGADYSVKNGKVYCTLYRYLNAHLTASLENVLADSVVFSQDTNEVAYIANVDGTDTLFRCSADNNEMVDEADQCRFFNGDILYLNKGELYFLSENAKKSLGTCGDIVGIYGDAVLARETDPSLQNSIKVFFPKDDTGYTVKNIYSAEEYCINGYVLSEDKLYFLSPDGAAFIDDVICLEPVQGENGVVYSNKNGISYSINGKTTPLNIQGHPLSAYRTKGRLLIKTDSWLYDGSSQIGNPYRVSYLEGELYLMYKNNTVTGSIRKLDSTQILVENALIDVPFYSIGGKVGYFVKQSFVDNQYALKIQHHTFNNVDVSQSVYGNAALDQIIYFNTSHQAVIYVNGKELTFLNGKIYL